jgi:hypothetical protein
MLLQSLDDVFTPAAVRAKDELFPFRNGAVAIIKFPLQADLVVGWEPEGVDFFTDY